MSLSLIQYFKSSEAKRAARTLFPKLKLGACLGWGAYGRVYLDRQDSSKCIKLFMLQPSEVTATRIVFDRLIKEQPWWAARMYDYGIAKSPKQAERVRYTEDEGYINFQEDVMFCYYRTETLKKIRDTGATEDRVDQWHVLLRRKYGVTHDDCGIHNTMQNADGELKVIDFDYRLVFPPHHVAEKNPPKKDRVAA